MVIATCYVLTQFFYQFETINYIILFRYVWSGLIVVIAIFLNVYSKNKDKWDQQMKEFYERRILGKRTIKVLPAGNIV